MKTLPGFNDLSASFKHAVFEIVSICFHNFQLSWDTVLHRLVPGENLRIALPPPPAQRPEDFHRMAPISQAPAEPGIALEVFCLTTASRIFKGSLGI